MGGGRGGGGRGGGAKLDFSMSACVSEEGKVQGNGRGWDKSQMPDLKKHVSESKLQHCHFKNVVLACECVCVRIIGRRDAKD